MGWWWVLVVVVVGGGVVVPCACECVCVESLVVCWVCCRHAPLTIAIGASSDSAISQGNTHTHTYTHTHIHTHTHTLTNITASPHQPLPPPPPHPPPTTTTSLSLLSLMRFSVWTVALLFFNRLTACAERGSFLCRNGTGDDTRLRAHKGH